MTPGPWVGSLNSDGHATVSASDSGVCGRIAEVFTPFGSPSSSEFWEELKANTWVIVAAPDYYAATAKLMASDRGSMEELEALLDLRKAHEKANAYPSCPERIGGAEVDRHLAEPVPVDVDLDRG